MSSFHSYFPLPVSSDKTDGVFTLPDSDSYTDSYSDSYEMGPVIMCRTVSTDSYSDADVYCTQFDTDIGTYKVVL